VKTLAGTAFIRLIDNFPRRSRPCPQTDWQILHVFAIRMSGSRLARISALIAIRESRIALRAGHEFSNPSQNRSPETAFLRLFDEELEWTIARLAQKT